MTVGDKRCRFERFGSCNRGVLGGEVVGLDDNVPLIDAFGREAENQAAVGILSRSLRGYTEFKFITGLVGEGECFARGGIGCAQVKGINGRAALQTRQKYAVVLTLGEVGGDGPYRGALGVGARQEHILHYRAGVAVLGHDFCVGPVERLGIFVGRSVVEGAAYVEVGGVCRGDGVEVTHVFGFQPCACLICGRYVGGICCGRREEEST